MIRVLVARGPPGAGPDGGSYARRPGTRVSCSACIIGRRASYVFKHPAAFALRVLKGFRANQGLLLAGAVAYYSLLSLIPLLILIVIALSHVIDEAELLYTLGRYLEWLAPGQSASADRRSCPASWRTASVVGWILLGTMLFFSSLAFTVLENAMSVIFLHRVAIRRRRFLVSAILPYCYILSLGVGLLIVTVVSNDLQRFGEGSVSIFGRSRSLGDVSGVLLYLLGFAGRSLRPHLRLPRDAGRPPVAAASRWPAASPPRCCGRSAATSSSGTSRRLRRSTWSTAR